MEEENKAPVDEFAWKYAPCQKCGKLAPTRIIKKEDADGNEVEAQLCKTCIEAMEKKKEKTVSKYSGVSFGSTKPHEFAGSFWKPKKKEKKK